MDADLSTTLPAFSRPERRLCAEGAQMRKSCADEFMPGERPPETDIGFRMGRYPAEIAEGAEGDWEGGKGTSIGAVFNNCLGQLNRYH